MTGGKSTRSNINTNYYLYNTIGTSRLGYLLLLGRDGSSETVGTLSHHASGGPS